MNIYDLYGIDCQSLDEARARIEQTLAVKFSPHESSYHCGDYYRHESVDGEHMILQRNYDPFDDEWTEPQSRERPILLYLNKTHRSDEIRRKLEAMDGIILLRHQEI